MDAEMEMFTRQQDGEDITDIQQRVESLRKEASKMGISQRPPRGRGGYRGGRGIGRGYFAVVSPRGGVRGRGGGLSQLHPQGRPAHHLFRSAQGLGKVSGENDGGE